MSSRRSSINPVFRGISAFSSALVLASLACEVDDRETAVLETPTDEGGAALGVCIPGATECVSGSQRRVCSDDGRWSEPESCALACVSGDCGGECMPGEQRCVSSTAVQRCSELGLWSAAMACPGACSANECVRECSPNESECLSATEARRCSEQGLWQAPVTCDIRCEAGACSGECEPGSVRCDAASSQRCDERGAWRDVPRCASADPASPDAVCPPGSLDLCGDLCLSLENDPENCGACGNDCGGGTCSGGRCQPLVLGSGFTSPSAVALSETHVYFREGAQGAGRVLRIPKGGGPVEVVAQGVSNLVGVAIGGEQIYFASGNAATLGQGQVLRANLDGSEQRPFSPLRAPGIFSVIVPGLNVYYTERSGQTTVVYRAGLLSQGQTGTGNEVDFASVMGALLSMTVNSGCMYYVAQGTPQQLLRKCTPAADGTVHYTGGNGEIRVQPVASTDADYLYFTQGDTLSRIELDPPATPEALLSGGVAPPTVDADALYYFSPTEEAPGGGCSNAFALYRASKQPGAGAPTLILPAPLACPLQVAVDGEALYWTSGNGSVLQLAK